MAASPTQRTLKHFRELGFDCQVVERWNQWAKVRQDLFGFIDIVAMKDGHIVGIQATSASNTSARIKKILGLCTALNWIRAGGEILVVGWKKKAGSRSWEPTIREITLDDFRDLPTGTYTAYKSHDTAGRSSEYCDPLVEGAAGDDP